MPVIASRSLADPDSAGSMSEAIACTASTRIRMTSTSLELAVAVWLGTFWVWAVLSSDLTAGSVSVMSEKAVWAPAEPAWLRIENSRELVCWDFAISADAAEDCLGIRTARWGATLYEARRLPRRRTTSVNAPCRCL